VNARERAPFKSLRDFVARTKLDVPNIENLIGAGGFDGFGLSRRQLLWQLWIADQWRDRGIIDPKLTAPPLPQLSPWGKLRWEYSAQQFSIDAHPMELLRSKLHSEVRRQDALRKLRNGVRTGVAGLVVCIQKPATANGVSFMTLEDESGLLNVAIFPDIYAEYRSIFKLSPFVYVYGILQREGDLISIQAQSFAELSSANAA
jgi:error-prone DNA polymerase